MAHARLAGLWDRQHDVGELGRAEVPLVVTDAGGIEADGVHDRDVRAAGVFAEIDAACIVAEGESKGGL